MNRAKPSADSVPNGPDRGLRTPTLDVVTEASHARRRLIGRIVFLVITLIAFYFVLPGLLATFDALPRLRDVYPAWFVVVVLCSRARASWRSGSSSGSRSAPRAGSTSRAPTRPGTRSVGRSPAASPRVARSSSRCSPRPASTFPTATTALAAAGLLSTATLFALPVLALPAVPFVAINEQLVEGALLAVFMFFVLLAFGAWMIRSDRAIAGVGRAVDWVAHRFHIGDGSDIGARVVESRNVIRHALRHSWKRALPAAAANQLFDFLALEASLLAVGASVDPLLVLLAYVAAATLSMIPITPGGLGFVEAGLAGVLTLAGASPDDAVLATLLYRLFSYWLPLPAGPGRVHLVLAPAPNDARRPRPRPTRCPAESVPCQARAASRCARNSAGIGARLVRRRLDAHVRDHAGAHRRARRSPRGSGGRRTSCRAGSAPTAMSTTLVEARPALPTPAPP